MASSAVSGSMVVNFPAGMVIPYAGAAIPPGWLECNGAEVDISAHPVLAAALGSTWNTAKNPLTGANYAAPAAGKFRLPDMRGAFLRGSSGGVNNAQGVATGLAEFQAHKTAKNGLGNGASSISGSATSGGVDHSHTQNTNTGFNGAGQPYVYPNVGPYFWSGYGNSGIPTQGASAFNHPHGLSATAAAQTITGDSETRPDSVGVRYLIKC